MKTVNFGYSLSRTLFGTRQKCGIHRRFCRGLQSEKGNFKHSLSLTLFGTPQQKSDIHLTFFWFTV